MMILRLRRSQRFAKHFVLLSFETSKFGPQNPKINKTSPAVYLALKSKVDHIPDREQFTSAWFLEKIAPNKNIEAPIKTRRQ